MWTSEGDGEPAPHSRALLVLSALATRRLCRQSPVPRSIADRAFAAAAAQEIYRSIPSELLPKEEVTSVPHQLHALGAGYAITEFLIAPLETAVADLDACENSCRLGGLLNLALVAYDRALDDFGAEPSFQGGPLFAEYLRRVELTTSLDVRHYAGKLGDRFFQAENATVTNASRYSFRQWLRKSSQEFVLMVLPALAAARARMSEDRIVSFTRWSYQMGVLFGAIDDAADYANDIVTGHPNIWRMKADVAPYDFAERIARRAQRVLQWWQSEIDRCPAISLKRAEALAGIFTVHLWGWLEPVPITE